MRKHLRTHFEFHQCDTCGKTFKHKRLLYNHVSAIHQDDPTIPCKCKLNIKHRTALVSKLFSTQIAPDYFQTIQQEIHIKS